MERERILVVEDSPTQAMLLQEALEAKHQIVKVARNGIEALETIPAFAPTVIVSDIEMPEMNGYELCRQVKQNPAFKAIPLILITNLTDSRDAIRGIECGADNFVTKPCDVDFLINTISDALQNSKRSPEPNKDHKREFIFKGEKHFLQIDEARVTDLLLSTFASAIQKNMELELAYRKLNKINEEMEQKNKLLEKLNQEKNQFLGMAAHDLRNPLVIISRYSQMVADLLQKNGDEASFNMLQKVIRSSTFMLQLINDLLDISAIESGHVNLHMSDNDMASLIDEVILLASLQAEKKQVSIEKCYEPFELKLRCDRDKIEQVLINLLTNAIKFSNPGQIIEILVDLKSDEIIMAIQDHGVGIAPEKKDHLFNAFAKETSKGTAGEPSTGLGLAIVQKLVLSHQGRVWVESETGKGSVFYVALPRNKL
jgi:two-component system sensor histidine kinase/response regulator